MLCTSCLSSVFCLLTYTRGAENAGVENAGATKYGKQSEENTPKYQTKYGCRGFHAYLLPNATHKRVRLLALLLTIDSVRCQQSLGLAIRRAKKRFCPLRANNVLYSRRGWIPDWPSNVARNSIISVISASLLHAVSMMIQKKPHSAWKSTGTPTFQFEQMRCHVTSNAVNFEVHHFTEFYSGCKFPVFHNKNRHLLTELVCAWSLSLSQTPQLLVNNHGNPRHQKTGTHAQWRRQLRSEGSVHWWTG